ncbi:MAG TPA: cell division protein FtsL [Terriglobia bacterium]|nr:cell division protein FtsL [Terriglobia bacterium]
MATAARSLPAHRHRPPRAPIAGRAPLREVYFVKHIDNSRIVREVDGAKRRECYALVGLLALGFALSFIYAWQHFQCVRYGYQIEQLRQQQHALAEWNRGLRLEEASLEDPKLIDTEARTQLGLREPDPRQVLRFDQPRNGQTNVGEPQLAESGSGAGALWAWLGHVAGLNPRGRAGP